MNAADMLRPCLDGHTAAALIVNQRGELVLIALSPLPHSDAVHAVAIQIALDRGLLVTA